MFRRRNPPFEPHPVAWWLQVLYVDSCGDADLPVKMPTMVGGLQWVGTKNRKNARAITVPLGQAHRWFRFVMKPEGLSPLRHLQPGVAASTGKQFGNSQTRRRSCQKEASRLESIEPRRIERQMPQKSSL
jgi:hypothetical protein